MRKKIIVLSGINLVDGGALSVFHDALKCLKIFGYTNKYHIIALVGNKKLFKEYKDDFELIEFAKSKKNWLMRIYYEYFFFKKYSKKKEIYVWLSLHDITPNVIAEKRYVYCHNPSPFNNMYIGEARYGIKYYLFSKFYRFLYAINIKKNDAIIVQQNWMRNEFQKMFKLKNIIVARPSIPEIDRIISQKGEECIFVFPSFPRYYKNFQAACEAVLLLQKRGINNYKLYITLDGTENSYSKELYQRYKHNKNIVFCGLLSRDELYSLYGKASALIFMSKLETWGMPIIEFKQTNKPIILADLPYAHETIGEYGQVEFVEPDDYVNLAISMQKVIQKEKLGSVELKDNIKEPYAENWKELFNIILK